MIRPIQFAAILALALCACRKPPAPGSGASSSIPSDDPLTPAEKIAYDRIVLQGRTKPVSPVSDEEVFAALNSSREQMQREALGLLTYRGASGHFERANELLRAADLFVWLNAALYLGRNSQPESIPYLIKFLKSEGRALTARPEAIRYLQQMTGESHGDDFQA